MLFWFLCFIVPKKELQERVFVGALKAVEIMGWKAFTAKGIINLLFYPMFPFKIMLMGCPHFTVLEIHKRKLIGKKRHDKLRGNSK